LIRSTRVADPRLRQEQVLDRMKDWTLDELAVSFLENGFWPQEALLAVREELYGKMRLVIVEGNRRLAALIFLKRAIDGKPTPARWREIAKSGKPPAQLFERIPYILVDNRYDIRAFLGFGHVTGIKEWKPAEKDDVIAFGLIIMRNGFRNCIRRRICHLFSTR
jgi:hypothetical protein